METNKEKSKCCGAGVRWTENPQNTGYFYCSKCGLPLEPQVDKQQEIREEAKTRIECAIENILSEDHSKEFVTGAKVFLTRIVEETISQAIEQERKRVLKQVEKGVHDVIWNEDGGLKSHDISYIVSSVMHYLMGLITNK